MRQVSTSLSVVFLVHDIHYGGGGERVTINLANHFEEKGYLVKIVSISPSKTSNIYKKNKGIEIDYLDIDFNTGSNIIKKIISIFKVRSHFKEYKRSTIILGIGNYPSLLLCFFPKWENIKTIGCQHLAYSGVKGIWALLRRILFHRLDCIVTLTKRDLPKFKKLNKYSVVIPNSIGLFSEKTALLANKRILFVGRMVSDKGYDFLLKVLQKVSELHRDWDFRIIGEGPLKKMFLRKVESSGLKEKISLLPSTELIVNEYTNASIYLMTSRKEGLPMVLLEAQACGLPIVSFDCETGPSDIVTDNKNGYLIGCFDIDKMVQKISILCSDRDLRIKFGKNAIQNVQKFRPEVINSMWENLFQSITHTETPSIDN